MSRLPTHNGHDRFMPDWIIGLAVRAALAPGLWVWGRAHAEAWPGVTPEIAAAAEYWALPFLSAHQTAQIAVWGAHLIAILLAVGFMTRLVGLALVICAAVYAAWVVPDAWPATSMFAALSFYLFARGGGALSVDGALAAAAR